jgi:hypothetical protein
LLKEAGYTNGIFKTQITLINKRVGSENELDKLWISEISPSRTEIRLFPNTKGVEINGNLQDRFNLLLNGGDFRDDVAKFAIQYVENIKATNIGSLLKQKYGDKWFASFANEYKIQNIDIFVTNIYNKFLESAINEFTGRISDITNINYGKPISTKPTLALNKEDVRKKVEILLVNSINKYLLIPDIQFGSKKSEKLESIDTAEKILQTKTSDLKIDTQSPIVSTVIFKTANETSKKLDFEKAIKEELKETLEPSIEPPVSKAKLFSKENRSMTGVYGNVSNNNRRIANTGFDFRNQNYSIDMIQNEQNLL